MKMKRKKANLDEVTPEPFKYLDSSIEYEEIDEALNTMAIILPKK